MQSGAQITSEINVSEILFSRRKLRSVIYNLVSNAIKYQPAGQQPIILVKTERQDNNLLITVKDNGLGIDPTKHDTIFENIKE